MTDATSDASTIHAAGQGGALRHASMLEDGILTGIVGAVVVAVWFLVLDFSRGQPFYTPSLLGSALLLGKSVDQIDSINFVMVRNIL